MLDMMPYVGDRAVATYNFTKLHLAEGQGRIRHVLVQLSSMDKSDKAASFSERRVSNIIRK